MKSFFRKASAWVRLAWVWTLLLVLCTALLVWFVGPLLAVNDYKVWASPTTRLLTISALLLGWGLGMVFINGRPGTGAIQESETDPHHRLRQVRMEDERRELDTRFKKAMRMSGSGYVDLAGVRRKDLPWYLLIGPPASGKTSLLDCSGCERPDDRPGRTPGAETQETRYCDWYFSEQAVLLNTAGRYLTQGDTEIDGNAWHTLLGQLRKRRRSRPLSGVLVAVPMDTLLHGSEEEVTLLACQIRGRLQEMQRRLHVDAPIYLVLSKSDSVPGFNEFFDSLTREDSDQVLGASFSRNQRGTDVTVVQDELDALLHRLNSQVILRMHQERDVQRRGRILDFPHQLGQIGPHLCLLVEKAFTANASSLRGFYLTSAQPNRALVPDTHGSQPAGRARFIQPLLNRLVFPEANLAGLDQGERSRIQWGQRGLYIGALTTLGLFGLLWGSGFSANHERLEHLRLLAQRWDQQRLSQGEARSVAMLESLDTRFEATRVFAAKGEASLYERLGLYQGEQSNPSVADAYQRELQEQLLPRVAQMFEAHIRGNLNDREQLLGSLRAYLMLNVRERRDNAWLKDRVAHDWSLRYTGNTVLQDGLNGHFERLLEQPFIHPLDEPLVAQARKILRSESLAAVVYRMLREQASQLPQYRLSQYLGPQGILLAGTDQVIPGFYTRRGYEQYFSVQGTALVTELLRDNWVLGEGTGLSSMDLRRLMVELEQLYFHDYADHWSEAIGQVTLASINDAGEGAGQLAGLTSAHSPILRMLVQIRENTRFQSVTERFDEVPPTVGNGGTTAQMVSTVQKVSSSLVGNLPDTAQKSLQRRFDPLHRLLEADEGPSADLTQALRALDEVQLQLASLARASAPEQAAFELARTRMGGKRDALSNLHDMSARLPRPVGAWFNELAEDSWRLVLSDAYRFLNQRYQSELYGFYGKAIHKRYPFNAHSASDVAINDFREFFKDQGLVDRFFERYLQPFVSGTAGHYRLRGIDGQSLPMSRAFLDQVSAAHIIRQSFFAENPAEPKVQFKLEPYTLDPMVSRSEFRFGDRLLEYRHGPILPVVFTWPSDAQDGRASLVLEKLAERGVGIEKNTGPWSLFRLFDLMQTEYLKGRDVRVLKADLGGLRANYLLTSQRTPNPFDMSVLRTFRMPVQL